MRVEEVPFLIVGAGPTGLTLARLLAALGRTALIVERRAGAQTHPSAHVVNARSLEIFRQAGFDGDAIVEIAADPADAGHVNFVTRLQGELIGRLPFERQGPEVFEVTPTPLRNISQHRLEPILAAGVVSAGVDLRYGVQWESSRQDEHGVTSVLTQVATGETFEVRSDWLLAADGAGSRIRKSLGIDMIGPASLETYMAIHFRADLREAVHARPGVLHFVMDPEVRGVLIAHDVASEWVYMTGYDATRESESDFDESRCRDMIRAAVGDLSIEVEVVGAGAWNMSAQVAERMRDRRTFLLGDAAHRFPPTGGLGLNSGVGDAHNLAWKLGAIADGWAAESVLDTYEVERRPIAEANNQQSLMNAVKIVLIGEALGLTESSTGDDVLRALTDPARRDAIDAAVAEQQTHFDMIGLQLGYRYAEGALASPGEPIGEVDPRHFDPRGTVGERLPHAWLEDGRSTLDLIPFAGMTLISVGAHDAWAVEATLVDQLGHVALGPDMMANADWHVAVGLGDSGALLVRPDQHIAWRSDEPTPLADVVSACVRRTPRR
ncbi:MAG: FAD-dependent monooxygenase [Actinomycetota bacterium]